MRGRPGKGAFVGLLVGMVLATLLTVLPSMLTGDTYETVDSLVFLGLPLVVVCTAVGALIGAPSAQVPDGVGPAKLTDRQVRRGRVPIAVVSVCAALLMTALVLGATGVVGAGLP